MDTIRVGDLVRLKNGTSPIKVTRVTPFYLWGHYVSDRLQNHPIQKREKKDFVLVQSKQPKEVHMTTKLFKTNTGLYGEFVAKDGHNTVLRMGDGTYQGWATGDLEPVRPYTIQIRDKHYELPERLKGKLKVGDMLHLTSSGWGPVTAIDTGAEDAPMLPETTRRVVTEEI